MAFLYPKPYPYVHTIGRRIFGQRMRRYIHIRKEPLGIKNLIFRTELHCKIVIGQKPFVCADMKQITLVTRDTKKR